MAATPTTCYVPARAVAWVSDEPIPGLVKVELTDADGKTWEFIDKAPMFDPEEILKPDSHYPVEISLACSRLSEPGTGEDSVLISTAHPWGLETVDGNSDFWIEASRIRNEDLR
jgi:hypothetical protein